MRLWSLHPSYLDAKGLVALWREGLLAQKVLQGKTKGYKNHPQLNRFKEHAKTEAAIAAYLKKVCEEATARGYNFDGTKIAKHSTVEPIKVTAGQLEFEMQHLCQKLKTRDPAKHKVIVKIKKIETHPLFKLIPGDIADWEKG